MANDVRSLEPGYYRVTHNGRLIGTINVQGIWSDGCDLRDLFKDRKINEGDEIEYKAVKL
jgi:hypothetical protein